MKIGQTLDAKDFIINVIVTSLHVKSGLKQINGWLEVNLVIDEIFMF